MERNCLRRSLLGAIRYGKPLVIDVMDVDMWDEVEAHFDAVEPGLWRRVMDKSLLKNEGYLKLVRSVLRHARHLHTPQDDDRCDLVSRDEQNQHAGRDGRAFFFPPAEKSRDPGDAEASDRATTHVHCRGLKFQ